MSTPDRDRPRGSAPALPGILQPLDPQRSPESAATLPGTVEIGGPPGPEPTRYGDWERGGRCIDF